MNLLEIKAVIDFLIVNGITGYTHAEHDIVYLPVEDEDSPFAAQLEQLGCVYQNYSWAFYT